MLPVFYQEQSKYLEMKKIIAILILSVVLASCSEYDNAQYDPGEGFVQFSSFPSEIGEDDEATNLTVQLGRETNPDGVTVNFSVNSEDQSRFEVTPSSGSLEIPAGEFTADITITPVDNISADGSESVEITLESSSDVAIGVGGEGINASSTGFTIVDDDCPVDTQAFVGTFSVDEVFSPGGTNAGLSLAAAFGESYQVEISQLEGDPSGTKFVITNSDGFNQFFEDGTNLTLFTCTQTVSIDNKNIALFADLTVEETSYDEGTSTISISGPLGDFGPYEIKLKKLD